MDAYIGEVRAFGFDRIPEWWVPCDGRLLNIAQYQALYSLLGTMYGGDGRTNFGLPNLNGRAVMGVTTLSASPRPGGGEAAHPLTTGEINQHTHRLNAAQAQASVASPTGQMLAAAKLYAAGTPTTRTTLHPDTIGAVGGAAHENMQPYLPVNYCIATQGIYPTRG